MSVGYAILFSFVICIFAALLEGLFAGKNVKTFLGKIRTPAYSPSLWVWSLIGVGYYVICFTILYRLFRFGIVSSIKNIALLLLLVMMAVNAVWNYVFFRRESLLYSFVLSVFYGLAAIALFICLIQFDKVAALVLTPYLIYLIYAFYWGYELLKLNEDG